MSRHARRKSETGIYHIMLRGINKQKIFEDNEDYSRFIDTFKRYKFVCEYKIFAYCLMPNHIHLLLKTEKEDLDLIMKRIAGSYVYWYNQKYKRIGHLFQDRFRSEPVDSDEYFLTVVRYIHQNPIKSGLCKNVCDYPFSSYNSYLDNRGIIDIDFCFEMIGKEEFVKFNNTINEDICLDVEDKKFQLNDKEVKLLIQSISNCCSIEDVKNLSVNDRNNLVKELRKNNVSIRQIVKLTGLSDYLVRRL